MKAKKFKPRREIIAELKAKRKKEDKKEEYKEEKQEKQQLFLEVLKSRWEELWASITPIAVRQVKKYRRKSKRLTIILITFFQEFVDVHAKPFFKKNKRAVKKAPVFLKKQLITATRQWRDFFGKIARTITAFRYHLINGLLVVLVFHNLLILQSRYPEQALVAQVRAVNFWPTVPTSSLQLSQAAFSQGHETLAVEFLDVAESLMPWWSGLGLEGLYDIDYQSTLALIHERENKEAKLIETEALLVRYPYSIELLLTKAKLLYSLERDSEIGEVVRLIAWLDPGLPLGVLGEYIEPSWTRAE